MTTRSASTGMLAWTAIMLHVSACNGQPIAEAPTASSAILAPLVDTPQVDVRVNKRYDEHGNLIAYDSSYTSVYRGTNGDAAFMDSLFQDLMPGFGTRSPLLNDPGFNALFFPDSSFHQDFFHPGFFQKRMEMDQRYMRRMMEEMNRWKDRYIPRQLPPGGPWTTPVRPGPRCREARPDLHPAGTNA